jgi:hypothetical protein
MSRISPKLIDVESNRVGGELVSTHPNGKGNTGDHGIYGVFQNIKGSDDRVGRFPTQLFTNIKNEQYKYVKYIT